MSGTSSASGTAPAAGLGQPGQGTF